MLFVFIFLLTLSAATSRYFIEGDLDSTYPLPIDVCNAFSLNFILYECDTSNPIQHVITKYNHSVNYPNCDDPNPIITNFSMNPDASIFYEISLNSFNCIGEDNYAEYITYRDGCDEYAYIDADHSTLDLYHDYFPTNIVTAICYGNNNIYSQEACNGFYGAELQFHSEFECRFGLNSQLQYYPVRQCKHNFRLNKCLENGTILTPYSEIPKQKTLPISQRITLIDLYFDLNVDINLTDGWLWDISQIAMDGTVFLPNGDDFWLLTTDYIKDEIQNLTYLAVTTLILINPDHGITDQFNHTQYLTATIPNSICNLNDLQQLIIGFGYTDSAVADFGYLSGTIPECTWNMSSLSWLFIGSTDITGTIPNNLCSSRINIFQLVGLTNLTGTIPSCYGDLNLQAFTLENMHGLTGTIPQNIICNLPLQLIVITNNTGLDDQRLPDCFSNARDLQYLQLSYSNFIGTVPTLPIRLLDTDHDANIAGLTYIGLNNNNFE
eukprot:410397_1